MSRQSKDPEQVRASAWVRRRATREIALLVVLAFVGWWAAHGNCNGENHLPPVVGVVVASSLMLPRLALSGARLEDGVWPARFTVRACALSYVWLALGFLFAPVTGRCGTDGWLWELAGTAIVWGALMATFLEARPLILGPWNRLGNGSDEQRPPPPSP